MMNFSTALLGAAVLLASGGCSRESEVPKASRITIEPLITRVAGLNFEHGDQIGLTIARSSDVYADNVMMTYNEGLFSSTDLVWYDTGDASTLMAYYPYLPAGKPSEFRVSADQSTGCESSDLLVAVKENVTPSSSTVGMVFRHMMTTVSVAVTNKTSSTISELVVGGTVLTADIDYTAQTAMAKAGQVVTEIKAFPITPNALYKVLTVPQTAVLGLTVKMSDGKTLSANFASNTLLQGKTYSASVIVEKDKLTPTLSGEVTDWEPGGSLKPGDEGGGSQEPTPDPGDNTMICQGTTYNTVIYGSLVWMAENLRYVPQAGGDWTGIWNPSANPTPEEIKTNGMFYTQEAALRLCPVGWRVPAETDFMALMAELKVPTSDFMPCAGQYLVAGAEYSNVGSKGYLVGATSNGDGTSKYLYNDGGQRFSIGSKYTVSNGASVRYVKDVQ